MHGGVESWIRDRHFLLGHRGADAAFQASARDFVLCSQRSARPCQVVCMMNRYGFVIFVVCLHAAAHRSVLGLCSSCRNVRQRSLSPAPGGCARAARAGFGKGASTQTRPRSSSHPCHFACGRACSNRREHPTLLRWNQRAEWGGEGRGGRSEREGMREGRGLCMLTGGRQRHPTPLPQRPKSTRACWRSLCSPPWLCMDANAHEPHPALRRLRCLSRVIAKHSHAWAR